MLYPGLILDVLRWPSSDLILMYSVGILIAWISWQIVHWE